MDDNDKALFVKDGNKYMFPVKIKRVYFGVNFDFIKNKDICEICKQKGIEIKKMKLSEKYYSLNVT